MDFCGALDYLKSGNRVARSGWNGKGMWIKLVTNYGVTESLEPGKTLELLPWIGMKTATEAFVPWLASQTDILAEDWEIV